MQSKWKVASNYVCGVMMYAVYRIIDTSAVDHSGNREMATDYGLDREKCQEIADRLNNG